MFIGAASGIGIYLILCALSTLIGNGLICLSRLDLPYRVRLFLAPILAFIFWSLLVGVTVGLRYPIKQIALWGWGVSGLLAIIGGYNFLSLIPGIRAWRFLPGSFSKRWPPRTPSRQSSLGQPITAIVPVDASRDDPKETPHRDEQATKSAIKDRLVAPGIFLFCLFLPIFAMARYFANDLTEYGGSIMPDGWGYVAIGRYLWEQVRGTNGGLPPIDQYGSIFASVRYISSSLLGFFSPLVRAGDTQSTSALLQAWAIFNFACSVALFGITERRKTWVIAIATLLSVTGAWTLNAIWASNYDQLLAIVYLPAFAAILNLLDPRRWQWWLVLGAAFAGILYTYPEFAPVIIAATFILALPQYWRSRQHWFAWLGGGVFAVLIAVFIVSPFLKSEILFFRGQLMAGSLTSGRPGEGFLSGLTMQSFEPSAFWGLGGEFRIGSYVIIRNIAGALLSLMAICGIVYLFVQRRWHIAVVTLIFSLGAIYYIVHYHYSYGSYKFISIGWWALVVTLVTGIECLVNSIPPVIRRPVALGTVALTALIIVSQGENLYQPENKYQVISSAYRALAADQFRQVQGIDRVIGNQPVMILVDDWLASEWAVYYLRDHPISVGASRMYMATPANTARMQQAPVIPPDDIKYILTDTSFDPTVTKWQLVWSGGPYRLWHANDAGWMTITHITDKLGFEQGAGEHKAFWLTQDLVNVHVISSSEARVFLQGDFVPGPSLPDTTLRTVSVATDHGFQQVVSLRPGMQAISLPVGMGETIVTLKVLDAPTLSILPNGDPRALLLGASNLSLSSNIDTRYSLGEMAPEPSDFTLDVTFATRSVSTYEPLITAGKIYASDFVYVHYLNDGRVSFVWIHWGWQPMEGAPISIEKGHPYKLHAVLDRPHSIVSVSLNDTEVLHVTSDIYPVSASQITIGSNTVGGNGPGPVFSGTVTTVSIR